MRALSDWFYANELSLNVQKTNFVVFAPNNTNNNITSITLGNQQILKVNNLLCFSGENPQAVVYSAQPLCWSG